MIRRFGLALSILFLVAVLAGVIAAWAEQRTAGLAGLPAFLPGDQLGQRIQTLPPPAFYTEDSSDSSAMSCEPEDLGYPSFCYTAYTEATDTMKLASIVEDLDTDPAAFDPAWLERNYDYLLQVWFVDASELPAGDYDIATGYCFVHKSVAVSAVGSALKDAELLGKTDNCYLALYKEPFSGKELLKPSH